MRTSCFSIVIHADSFFPCSEHDMQAAPHTGWMGNPLQGFHHDASSGSNRMQQSLDGKLDGKQ